MNPIDIYNYIKEKGYDHSHIYRTEEPTPEYSILVMKDYPKEERSRQWFDAPSLTELFYIVQAGL